MSGVFVAEAGFGLVVVVLLLLLLLVLFSNWKLQLWNLGFPLGGFVDFRIGRFGDLAIWRVGKVAELSIWRFGDLAICAFELGGFSNKVFERLAVEGLESSKE